MSKLKAILCVLVGHSRIVHGCFGYIHCERCGDQVGDTLAGVYDLEGHVLMEHACETCEENWEGLTWRDKLLAPRRAKVFAKP